MSTIGSYPTRTFKESQKFLVLDPEAQSTSLVLGSDLVNYIAPSLNYVFGESTRLAAENTDYEIGSLIQTSGATAPGDNFAATYLVVEGGAGDFPMINGNDLLVIKGDEFLREQLIDNTSGVGSDLIAHTGTSDTVTEALDKRTIYVGSVAELLSYPVGEVADGTEFIVTGYFSGSVQGGGGFIWDASGSKADHNGITVIDPSVNFYTAGDEASVQAWYRTSNVGTGVFVRKDKGYVSDSDAGVISVLTYDYNTAFINRYAYETLLRDTSINNVEFEPSSGFKPIWGSVNVGRDDLNIHHKAGCVIQGYYSDPAEIATGQAGHMFGFVDYVDPYPGTNYTVASRLNRINYQLDGVCSTIYRVTHTSLHNNNAIAFFRADDCSVVGIGGIGACDHNGIAFDGECVNPKVDVAYIKAYDDRAVTMKGDPTVRGSCSVSIGTLKDGTRAGSVGESILVEGFTYAKVRVGDAFLPSVTLGTLLSSRNMVTTDLVVGFLDTAIFMVNIDNTENLYISKSRYKDVTYLVRRGGTNDIPLKKISLRDVTCDSDTDTVIYLSQINTGTWKEFEVINCDFENVVGSITAYQNKVSGSAPEIYNFKNNRVTAGWVYDADIYNRQLGNINTVVGSFTTTFDISGANGDNPYTKLGLILTDALGRIQEDFFIPDLLLTASDYVRTIDLPSGGTATITLSRTGTSVTATVSGSSISSYTLRN